METHRTNDPVERLILIYLGDGADQNDEAVWPFTGLFPPEGDPLPVWTGLDGEALYAAFERLRERGLISESTVGGRAETAVLVAKLDVDGDEP